MQSSEGNNNEDPIFVIEVCQNCKDHHWNTRHDQAKYLEYFNRGKSRGASPRQATRGRGCPCACETARISCKVRDDVCG